MQSVFEHFLTWIHYYCSYHYYEVTVKCVCSQRRSCQWNSDWLLSSGATFYMRWIVSAGCPRAHKWGSTFYSARWNMFWNPSRDAQKEHSSAQTDARVGDAGGLSYCANLKTKTLVPLWDSCLTVTPARTLKDSCVHMERKPDDVDAQDLFAQGFACSQCCACMRKCWPADSQLQFSWPTALAWLCESCFSYLKLIQTSTMLQEHLSALEREVHDRWTKMKLSEHPQHSSIGWGSSRRTTSDWIRGKSCNSFLAETKFVRIILMRRGSDPFILIFQHLYCLSPAPPRSLALLFALHACGKLSMVLKEPEAWFVVNYQ